MLFSVAILAQVRCLAPSCSSSTHETRLAMSRPGRALSARPCRAPSARSRALSARSRSRSRSSIPRERVGQVSDVEFDEFTIAEDKATLWGKLIQSRIDYAALAKYVLEKERENEQFKSFFEFMFTHIADAMFRTARCRTDRSRSRDDLEDNIVGSGWQGKDQKTGGRSTKGKGWEDDWHTWAPLDPCNRMTWGRKDDDEDHCGESGDDEGGSDGEDHGGERGDDGGSDELTEACEAHRDDLGETEEEYDKFKRFYDFLLQKLRVKLGIACVECGRTFVVAFSCEYVACPHVRT